jgi:hypothetical protein
VNINNVVAAYASSRAASIISGIPGHPVEDITLSRIRILYNGGDGAGGASRGGRTGGRGTGEPPAGPDPFGVPELEDNYPEPTMFGSLPAYGMYVRHARRLTMDHADFSLMRGDTRPPFMIYDANGAQFEHVTAQAAAGSPLFVLNRVTDFSTERVTGLADSHVDRVDENSISGTNVPAPASTYTPAAPSVDVPPAANTPIPPAKN